MGIHWFPLSVWGSVKVLVDETSLARSHAEVRCEPANSSGTSLSSQWAPSEHGQVASPSAGLLKQLARENSCPLGDGHACLSKRIYALKHRQRESMWNETATWTAILDQSETAFSDFCSTPLILRGQPPVLFYWKTGELEVWRFSH